ncbi:MAG: hypothetical protein NUV75_02105 [Gallionella sp.]|nr:hypothetical protein [Gallionella sp.]
MQWNVRYPQERERVNRSAAAQVDGRNTPRSTLKSARAIGSPASAAVPIEWHDDKDERADRFVQTGEGDLTTFGRPMRQGK